MVAIARIVGVLFLLVGVASSGCATIVEKKTLVAGPTTQRVVELGADAPEVERVALELDGSRVVASPIHPGRCVRRVTETTESTVHVSREYSAPAAAWAPPIVALVAGAWGLASGLRILPALLPQSGPQGDVRPVELGLGIAGLSTALIWSVINIVRAVDSHTPGDPTVVRRDERYTCPPTPRVDSRLELLINGESITRGRTGPTGAIEVPEAAQARLSSALVDAAASVDGKPATLRWFEPALYFVGSRTPEGQLFYLERFPNGAHATLLRRQSGERVLSAITADVTAALGRKDTPATVVLAARLAALQFDDWPSKARVAALLEKLEGYQREEARRARAEATTAVFETARVALQRKDAVAAKEVLARLDELLTDDEKGEPEASRLLRALRGLLAAELARAQKQVQLALQKRRFDDADALAERVTALGGDGDEVSARVADARDAAALASWRAFLGKCNRLAADLQAIERMWSCDANCQLIQRRILAAQERLQEEVPALPADEERRRQVAELCESAACGLCP